MNYKDLNTLTLVIMLENAIKVNDTEIINELYTELFSRFNKEKDKVKIKKKSV